MYTKIDIIDNGKGISESHQAEIFKRFYREEDVHDIEGIGIGLYLSRKIISLQGGYIKVTSEIGKGQLFLSSYLINKFLNISFVMILQHFGFILYLQDVKEVLL